MQLELTEQILKHIEQHEKADTLDLAAVFCEEHQKVVGALKSIEAHGELLNSEATSRKAWQVSDEGQFVIEHGSHEACVYNAIPAGGISQAELMKVSETLIGRLQAEKNQLHHLFSLRRTPKSALARLCHMAGSSSTSQEALPWFVGRWNRSRTSCSNISSI